MTDRIAMTIGGRDVIGFSDVSVRRSISALAANFTLQLQFDSPTARARLGIIAGAAIQLRFDDDVVLNGHIDSPDRRLSESTVNRGVTGRSLAADPVDCSASPGSFRKRTALQIATKLCQPYSVPVTDTTGDETTLGYFAVKPAESVGEALNRLADLTGRRVYSAWDGGIIFARLDGQRSAESIIHGLNCNDMQVVEDMSQRFSNYKVLGQKPATKADWKKETTQIAATASDPGVERYRFKIIKIDGAATYGDCLRRARWEAAVRAGQSVKVMASVPGHRRADRQLWDVNLICPVYSAQFGVDEDMAVQDVVLNFSEKGSITRMTLVPPITLTPQPLTRSARRSLLGLKAAT